MLYLERFFTLYKNKNNLLLLKYYLGCLKLRLGDNIYVDNEYLEFVYLYTEEIQSTFWENKYTPFIKLQNDLLNKKNIKIERIV